MEQSEVRKTYRIEATQELSRWLEERRVVVQNSKAGNPSMPRRFEEFEDQARPVQVEVASTLRESKTSTHCPAQGISRVPPQAVAVWRTAEAVEDQSLVLLAAKACTE